MVRFAIQSILAFALTNANAVTPPISTIMLANAANAHAKQVEQQVRHTPVVPNICLWQYPGTLEYVNLYRIQTLRVKQESSQYITKLYFGYDSYEIKHHNVPNDYYVNLILARLKECQY